MARGITLLDCFKKSYNNHNNNDNSKKNSNYNAKKKRGLGGMKNTCKYNE